jgi:hypothetical protein
VEICKSGSVGAPSLVTARGYPAAALRSPEVCGELCGVRCQNGSWTLDVRRLDKYRRNLLTELCSVAIQVA